MSFIFIYNQPMDIDQFDSQPEFKNDAQSNEASIKTFDTPRKENVELQEMKPTTPSIRFVEFPSNGVFNLHSYILSVIFLAKLILLLDGKR